MEPRSHSTGEEDVPAGTMTAATPSSPLRRWLWHPFVIVASDAPLDQAALQAFDGGDGIPLLVHQSLPQAAR